MLPHGHELWYVGSYIPPLMPSSALPHLVFPRYKLPIIVSALRGLGAARKRPDPYPSIQAAQHVSLAWPLHLLV